MDEKELLKVLEAHRLWVLGDAAGKRADLYGANLYGADLTGANLYGANLYGADLTGADLYGADLTLANLTGANLTGADLTRADLTGANLSGADLTRADLYGANLTIFQDLYLLKLQPPDAKLRAWKFVRKNGESPIQQGGKITYRVGESYSIAGDLDDHIQCAAGLNVATLPWCLKNSDLSDDVLIEVEFLAKDILAIPFGTDGKFRVSALAVIRSMTKEDAEKMMRSYLPKKEES